MLVSIILTLIIISVICLIKNKAAISATLFGMASVLMLVLIVNGLSVQSEPHFREDATLSELELQIELYADKLRSSTSKEKKKKLLLIVHELIYQYNQKQRAILEGKSQ